MIWLILTAFICLCQCADECKGINAQLNSIFDNYDTNSLLGMGSHDGRYVMCVGKSADYQRGTTNFHSIITQIWKLDMIYSPMNIVQKSIILDGPSVKKFVKNESQLASLYSFSNVEYLQVNTQEKNTYSVGVGIVSLVVEDVPGEKEEDCEEEEEKKNYCQLHFFNIRDDEVKVTLEQKPVPQKTVEKYEYPFKDAKPYYTISGNIAGYENKEAKNATSLICDSKMVSQAQMRLLNSSKNSVNVAEFVSLVYTQSSLKLVKYQWTDYPHDHSTFSILDARLLVPRVEKVDSDSFYSTHIEVSNDGFGLSKDGYDLIYVVSSIHKDQKQAIENYHNISGLDLRFEAYETIGSFLFVINSKNLQILDIQNIMKYTTMESHQVANHYPTSIDSKFGKIVISGTSFLTKNFLPSEPDPSNKNTAFFSLLTYSLESNTIQIIHSSYMIQQNAIAACGNGIGSMSKKDDLSFNAQSISFPIESVGIHDTNFIIGGSVFSWSDIHNHKGRSFLVNGSDVFVKRTINVGLDDSTSNVLREIYRVKKVKKMKVAEGKEEQGENGGVEGEVMYFNIYENGQRKEFAAYDADIWQVDCSVPNAALELASKIVFFVLVGISMVLFVGATVFFIAKAIYQARKRKHDVEKDPLL